MTIIQEHGTPSQIQPPRYMLVQSNLTCNLRCQHCHLWRNKDLDRKTDQYEELRLLAVQEFAEISPSGTVITCGGEPLAEPQKYFNLCEVTRRNHLTSMSVINGTLTPTQYDADALLTSGADEISLSIDSPHEAVHDLMRGARESFRRTTQTISLLVASRRRLKLPRKIYVMLMVCNVNYRHIAAAYDLALNQLGVDKLKLNFLQPTISCSSQHDAFWNLHTKNIDTDWLMNEIDLCESRYALDFNPRWKACVRSYLNALGSYHLGGPLTTNSQLCNSPDRNIVMEMSAQMRLCFHSQFPSSPYRQQGDLQRYWYSPETENLRKVMRNCRNMCGICHTFKKEPATREAAHRLLGA